jgi:hypothetical protein
VGQWLKGAGHSQEFCGRVFKSIACVALARKATDEIRVTIFALKFFGANKTNKSLVPKNR